MSTLIEQKASLYQQELRANSQLSDALNSQHITKLRWAGHKQNQVVRSDNSRNYAGGVNIAGVLKAEADQIFRLEYLPLLDLVTKKQSERIAKGHGSKIPLRFQRQLQEIQSRISGLKRKANDLADNVKEYKYVTNQKFQKAD